MEDQKQKSAGNHTHEGEGGRVFKENGDKGHDLLNTDSFTSGVGTEIRTPAEARKIDEIRNDADSQKSDS